MHFHQNSIWKWERKHFTKDKKINMTTWPNDEYSIGYKYSNNVCFVSKIAQIRL